MKIKVTNAADELTSTCDVDALNAEGLRTCSWQDALWHVAIKPIITDEPFETITIEEDDGTVVHHMVHSPYYVKDVARLSGLSVSTIHKDIRSGKLLEIDDEPLKVSQPAILDWLIERNHRCKGLTFESKVWLAELSGDTKFLELVRS